MLFDTLRFVCVWLIFFGMMPLLRCAGLDDTVNPFLPDLNFEALLNDDPEGRWFWQDSDDFLVSQAEFIDPIFGDTQIFGDAVLTNDEHGVVDESAPSTTTSVKQINSAQTEEVPNKSSAMLKAGEGKLNFSVSFMTTHTRAHKLMEILTKGEVCFVDVKDMYSQCLDHHSFQLDILYLMRNNVDIRETKSNYYQCFGVLKEASPPSEAVAIAMFNLLSEKRRSLFDLYFQLYLRGYREFSTCSLRVLEGALNVGGVHPYDRDIVSQKGLSISAECKKVWAEVKDLSYADMMTYLSELPEKHAYTLQEMRYSRLITCLWRLKEKGTLKILQEMRGSLEAEADKRTRKSQKMSRQHQIMTILIAHKNKEIALNDVFRMVTDTQKSMQIRPLSCKNALLKVVLPLAIGVHPIIYDKEKQTVKLLDQPMPLERPKKNTNLLTMIYDLMTKYEGCITSEELNYYAYKWGYWLECQKKGRQRFDLCANRYKESLAIQGYIDISSFAKGDQEDILCQRKIWSLVVQEGEVHDLAYYKKFYVDVIQKDIDAVRAVHALQKTPEFVIFYAYVKELDKARNATAEDCCKCLEVVLRQSPMTAEVFSVFCGLFGLKTEQEIWDIASRLTRRTKDGRLIYEPKKCLFSWDSEGCFPQPKKEAFLATLFSLKFDFPDIENKTLLYMIGQNGFQDVTAVDVHEALYGFAVLGLYSPYEQYLTQERHLVQLILASDAQQPEPEVNDHGRILWAWKIAYIVVNWMRDGSLHNFWRFYLGAPESVLPAKRMKLQTSSSDSEDSLLIKIPRIYHVVQPKNKKRNDKVKKKNKDKAVIFRKTAY